MGSARLSDTWNETHTTITIGPLVVRLVALEILFFVLWLPASIVAALVVTARERRATWPKLIAVGIVAAAAALPWRIFLAVRGLGGGGPEAGGTGLFSNLDRAWPSLRLAVSTLFDYHLWLIVTPLAVVAILAAFAAGARVLPLYTTLLLVFAVVAFTYSTWAFPSLGISREPALNPIVRLTGEAAKIVETLIAHPAVRRVNFTGSTKIGRIIAEIRKAGTRNPVFILDEIDKLGSDFRGDPSSALLEVLDPEQNNTFRDHYLDVPFDLSEVLFITTANVLDPIPAALRDRMEVLEIAGYTEEEKLKIATDHLVDKQVKNHGLTAEYIQFTDAALRQVIRGYTREAGVRNLEREIGSLCRKVARRRAEGDLTPARVTPDLVTSFLGVPRFETDELIERAGVPGVALGLAWTPAGGDVLHVEATRMPGARTLTLTGQLGDVMKESARAALSWIRAHAKEYGIDPDFFKSAEMHVHVPSGAIPKDGPSAGVTMATAMASELTGRPVRGDIAMTGEITLSGRVLPIGGVKEKVLAARRVGIHEVILPKQNAKNINEDLTPELRQGLTVHLVSTIDEVLALALQPVSTDALPARVAPKPQKPSRPVAARP
jgi:hypothetical protein